MTGHVEHRQRRLAFARLFSSAVLSQALLSAASFAVGAALPLVVAALAPAAMLMILVAGASLLLLAALGAVGARIGGAGLMRGAMRVTFWGAIAMAMTAGIGVLFGQ